MERLKRLMLEMEIDEYEAVWKAIRVLHGIPEFEDVTIRRLADVLNLIELEKMGLR